MIEDKNVIDNIIITPCSGAEYNGELARQVAIKLSENSEISSISSMHCSTIFLKNILLKNDILVQITKSHLKSSFSVIIDGCRISCVKTIFNFLELEPDLVIYVDEVVPKQKLNINDLEAFKNLPRLSNIKKEDINKVTNLITEKLKEKGLNIEDC